MKKLFENWNKFVNENTSPEEDQEVVDGLRAIVGQWKPIWGKLNTRQRKNYFDELEKDVMAKKIRPEWKPVWDRFNPSQRELFFDLLLQNVNVHREAALAPPEEEVEEEEVEI